MKKKALEMAAEYREFFVDLTRNFERYRDALALQNAKERMVLTKFHTKNNKAPAAEESVEDELLDVLVCPSPSADVKPLVDESLRGALDTAAPAVASKLCPTVEAAFLSKTAETSPTVDKENREVTETHPSAITAGAGRTAAALVLSTWVPKDNRGLKFVRACGKCRTLPADDDGLCSCQRHAALDYNEFEFVESRYRTGDITDEESKTDCETTSSLGGYNAPDISNDFVIALMLQNDEISKQEASLSMLGDASGHVSAIHTAAPAIASKLCPTVEASYIAVPLPTAICPTAELSSEVEAAHPAPVANVRSIKEAKPVSKTTSDEDVISVAGKDEATPCRVVECVKAMKKNIRLIRRTGHLSLMSHAESKYFAQALMSLFPSKDRELSSLTATERRHRALGEEVTKYRRQVFKNMTWPHYF